MKTGIERARELVEKLGMEPHVEGGYFVEVYKSPKTVIAEDGRKRRALTAIYYLLVKEDLEDLETLETREAGAEGVRGERRRDRRDNSRSKLHRVKSEELWFYCEGAPLELLWVEGQEELKELEKQEGREGKGEDAESREAKSRVRKTVIGRNSYFAVIPAGCWQAARTLGDYTLVSCVVAPGFTYEDFELYSGNILKYPSLREFL